MGFWLSKATPTLLSNKQQLNQEKVINWAGYPFIRSKYNSSSCKRGSFAISDRSHISVKQTEIHFTFSFLYLYISFPLNVRSIPVTWATLYYILLSNNIRQHIRLLFIHVCLMPYLGQVFIWILSDFEGPSIRIF